MPMPTDMKPWQGGDAAPADWGGGPVYFRMDCVAQSGMAGRELADKWNHDGSLSDIIGYFPRTSDLVTPEMMADGIQSLDTEVPG